MKLGLLGSGYMLLPHDEVFARAKDEARSPATRPWLVPLPVPPVIDKRDTPLSGLPPYCQRFPRRIKNKTKYYEIVAEQRWVSFHPDLPDTPIWGYRPLGQPDYSHVLGPTIIQNFGSDEDEEGGGLAVRQHNALPADHRGFGVTRTTVHLHGGHHPAEADGFPTNLEGTDGFDHIVAERGGFFDHFYPTTDPGYFDKQAGLSKEEPETTARQSMLWYHDHLLDFTGPNAYRGLAGAIIAMDNLDNGDETDPESLQLPCGPNREFDIPLVVQDKWFARNGALIFSSFDHDGFIGDKIVVNGAIQPYCEVLRRKYRFRFLNGSNARIYQIFLTNGSGQRFPMTQIASEGGLLAFPIPGTASFMLAPAERVEVVIDFADPIFSGQGTLYFENRLEMDEGRKPDGLLSRGPQILQLRLGARVTDPSFCGKPNPTTGRIELRPFPPVSAAELSGAVRRTFQFDRRHGAWAINGELAGHLERPVARSKRGQGEIWRLVNNSGGWWHPIHIHSELFRVIRRRGRTPPLHERDGVSKRDTILLKDNDEVEVFLKFRDHLGPFVFHCHNMEHEDLAMMARFDVVPGDGE
jgi:FtsP/CotA-like multicopper oxidase with cupredoxin domain